LLSTLNHLQFRTATPASAGEWKDYAHHARTQVMSLDAVEFLRRFLLHVLPTGMVRIRQFGFLANRVRQQKLALCRALLSAPPTSAPAEGAGAETYLEQLQHCPFCKQGRLVLIELIAAEPLVVDTS
jgi:hypothetical protein